MSAAATMCGAAMANAVPVTVRTAARADALAGTAPGAAMPNAVAAMGCEGVR